MVFSLSSSISTPIQHSRSAESFTLKKMFQRAGASHRTCGAHLIHQIAAKEGVPRNPYTALRILRRKERSKSPLCPTLGAVGDTTCSSPEYLCRRGGPSHYRAQAKPPQQEKPAFCRYSRGALGRTRTCDLLIRSDRVSDPIDPHWPPSALVYGLLLGR